MIVSHLTAYDAASETEQAFPQNSGGAVNLFDRYLREAEKDGIDIRRYKKKIWKYYKSKDEVEIMGRIRDLIKEADRRGIFIDITRILDEDRSHAERLETIFNNSRALAKKAGIRLTLPEIRPKNDRYCKFVEEGAMFITWDGHISPCSYILDEPFEQDCDTIDVPCCDCHWNLGLLNCLSDCR